MYKPELTRKHFNIFADIIQEMFQKTNISNREKNELLQLVMNRLKMYNHNFNEERFAHAVFFKNETSNKLEFIEK